MLSAKNAKLAPHDFFVAIAVFANPFDLGGTYQFYRAPLHLVP